MDIAVVGGGAAGFFAPIMVKNLVQRQALCLARTVMASPDRKKWPGPLRL